MSISIKAQAQLIVLSARTAANRTSNSIVEGLQTFVENRVVAGLQALDAKQDARYDVFLAEAARINQCAAKQSLNLKKALEAVEPNRLADIKALRKAAKV
jgi:hypothetical protein